MTPDSSRTTSMSKPAGSCLRMLGDALLHGVGDLHGVRARLLAHGEEHGGLAVEQGRGVLVLLAVDSTVGHVAHADGVPGLLPHHEVADSSAGSPTRPWMRTVSSPGPVSIRPPGVDRFWLAMARCTSTTVMPRAAQADGVERHVDLPLATADELDLADAVDGLEGPAHALVGELGHLADGVVLAR